MYVKESILCPLDMETLPNPFGGVNTHLWRNVAYVFGIVPSSTASYTRNEIGYHLIPGRERWLLGEQSGLSDWMTCGERSELAAEFGE